MTYVGESFARWISPIPSSIGAWKVLLSWEARRIFLNLIIVALYVPCFIIYDWIVETYPPFIEEGMEGSVTGPFLCFLVLLLAAVNLLYTFGWLFQIFGRTGSWSANLARYFLLGALLLSLLAVPVIGWFNYWEMNRINRANSS